MHKLRGGRAMLNQAGHESTAAMVAEVEDTRGWKEGCDGDGDEIKSKWALEPDTVLRISDCDRAVGLSIQWDTEEDRENALFKVDTMIALLRDFRKGLVAEQRLYVKRAEELARQKKDS
jgi:hypothetical protein